MLGHGGCLSLLQVSILQHKLLSDSCISLAFLKCNGMNVHVSSDVYMTLVNSRHNIRLYDSLAVSISSEIIYSVC